MIMLDKICRWLFIGCFVSAASLMATGDISKGVTLLIVSLVFPVISVLLPPAEKKNG